MYVNYLKWFASTGVSKKKKKAAPGYAFNSGLTLEIMYFRLQCIICGIYYPIITLRFF